MNSALLFPLLHSFYQFFLESTFILCAHNILVGNTASIDYLLSLVDVYHRHVGSDISFICFNKLSHISYVELLQVHFRINREEILLDLSDMSRNIDFTLWVITGIQHEENCGVKAIFRFIVSIDICSNQMCGVPSTFIYTVLALLIFMIKPG